MGFKSGDLTDTVTTATNVSPLLKRKINVKGRPKIFYLKNLPYFCLIVLIDQIFKNFI